MCFKDKTMRMRVNFNPQRPLLLNNKSKQAVQELNSQKYFHRRVDLPLFKHRRSSAVVPLSL